MLPGEQPTGGRSLTGYFIGTAKLIDVTIRPRRADDVPACVQALAEVHRKDGYPTRWPKDPADWLDSPGLLGAWVAEGAGVMAGHIALVVGVDDAELIKAAGRPRVELAMVSRFFVRPGTRGRHIGEALVRTATEFGSSQGFGLVLEVVKEPRSAAAALYERLGWQLVGQRLAGWTTSSGDRPQLCLYLLSTPSPPA